MDPILPFRQVRTLLALSCFGSQAVELVIFTKLRVVSLAPRSARFSMSFVQEALPGWFEGYPSRIHPLVPSV
ncbi:hypothetical protein F5883DRAFT_235290 [Diaporthe sp. PMI_573]|nr:hypothetical protein F5883DRAFT_235290 [Diaporthaceae sp. PMI_573]